MRDVAAVLRAAGLNIVDRDPAWPEGISENALMPLQHAGLAAQHGAAWRQNPALIDPDLGAEIEAGLKYTGVETARAWLASDRVARAAAAFCRERGGTSRSVRRRPAAPGRSNCRRRRRSTVSRWAAAAMPCSRRCSITPGSRRYRSPAGLTARGCRSDFKSWRRDTRTRACSKVAARIEAILAR